MQIRGIIVIFGPRGIRKSDQIKLEQSLNIITTAIRQLPLLSWLQLKRFL